MYEKNKQQLGAVVRGVQTKLRVGRSAILHSETKSTLGTDRAGSGICSASAGHQP